MKQPLTEEQIAIQLGYNEGYISQTRSRGKVSKKFVNSLEREFNVNVPRAEQNNDNAIRQDKAPKEPMPNFTPISTTDSTAGMAHTAGPDQPQTLQEAVRAFLNVSEAINKQADVLVKLAGLIPNGPQKP